MIASVYSVTGNYKKVNQDSVLLKTAYSNGKDIAILAVCDGMGGLANGEEASQLAALHLNRWFTQIFPYFLSEKTEEAFFSKIKTSLDSLVMKADEEIKKITRKTGKSSGTTMCVLLIVGNRFYTLNIGDSRAYKVTQDKCIQLTKDQTYTQLMIDQGKTTRQEMKKHPQRNALLQCIGAGQEIEPIYTRGEADDDDVFFVCSDGFRHLLSNEEFLRSLNPGKLQNEYVMQEILEKLVDLNLDRGEKDNISVVCLKMNA